MSLLSWEDILQFRGTIRCDNNIRECIFKLPPGVETTLHTRKGNIQQNLETNHLIKKLNRSPFTPQPLLLYTCSCAMVPDVVATLDGQNPGYALNGGNYTSLCMCVHYNRAEQFYSSA